MKTELLSPAKNKECAIAAIDCGADAIYMGAMSFGARKNAPNTLEDIEEVVKYAHKYWVKVFITINTILNDNEIEDAVKLIKELDKIGVDAIIIQDMGLLERLVEEKMEIPIHISTQCDNREAEKVNFFNNIGVTRVVLARELSLDKIKEIHENNPNLELEAFMHGALCVSYSGQCYLSQFIGGRSANRGECAQPCRKKYSIVSEDGKIIKKDIHALCLKDFNASIHLEDMAKNGVYSFKIEGRLKDTNYVKNITAYYRQELDKFSDKSSSGKSFIEFTPNPEKTFNRKFTDYFLEKRKDCFNFVSPKSFGCYLGTVEKVFSNKIIVTTKENISNQDGICYEANNTLNGFLVNKSEQNGNKITIYPNKDIQITSGTKLYRNLDIAFEKLLEKKTKRQIGINVTIKNNRISIIDEDGINLEYIIYSTEQSKNPDIMKDIFKTQFSKTGETDFYINDFNIVGEVPFLPKSTINQIRRDLLDKLVQLRLDNYVRQKQTNLTHCKFYKEDLDYRANIYNKKSKEFYEKCGANVNELAMEDSAPKRQIELMRTKHCIKFALGICQKNINLSLIDEDNNKFPLKFDCKNCEMVVLSPNKC